MIITRIIVAICSLLFFMVGADKFLAFLEPPCSLANSISPIIWKTFGVMQIAAGVLIWLPSLRKYVAGFFFAFMLVFTGVHISAGTYDVGGALSMAVLLGLLVWNPSFMKAGNSVA